MNTDTLTEIGKEVPALALLVFVVWIFMKYLESRDRMMKGVFDEHLDARKQTREALMENTKALRDAAETRGQLIDALRDLREKL